MMKKLAKAALLAAATAFLLAGFPACSSDDDDDVYITNPDDSDADKDSEGDKTEDEGDQGDKDDESEGDKSDEEGDGEEEGSGEEDGDGEGEDDKEDDSDDDNKEDDSDDNESEGDTPAEYESWSLDFTTTPGNPAVGTSSRNLSDNDSIGGVLTFKKGSTTSNSKYHSDGYLSLQVNTELTFEAEAAGTLAITYTSGSDERGFTVKKDDTEIGSGIAKTGSAQTVTLPEAGTYRIVITGGENKIGTISLTYN